MAETISSGRPRKAAIIRTRNPYLLFNLKADDDYVVRLFYQSKNVATNATGTSEVSSITNTSEVPILAEQYHELLIYLAGMRIAGELMVLKNKDNVPRFPGMADAFKYYEARYREQLAIDLEYARRRHISRERARYNYAGSELIPFYSA